MATLTCFLNIDPDPPYSWSPAKKGKDADSVDERFIQVHLLIALMCSPDIILQTQCRFLLTQAVESQAAAIHSQTAAIHELITCIRQQSEMAEEWHQEEKKMLHGLLEELLKQRRS